MAMLMGSIFGSQEDYIRVAQSSLRMAGARCCVPHCVRVRTSLATSPGSVVPRAESGGILFVGLPEQPYRGVGFGVKPVKLVEPWIELGSICVSKAEHLYL